MITIGECELHGNGDITDGIGKLNNIEGDIQRDRGGQDV
jgi:hypothetical protein